MGYSNQCRVFDSPDLEVLERVCKAAWTRIKTGHFPRDHSQDAELQKAIRKWVFALAGNPPVDFNALLKKLEGVPTSWLIQMTSEKTTINAARGPPNEALVFIVDDDETVRNGLQQLLESVGLKVICFRSSVEFLKSTLPDQTSCLVVELRSVPMGGLQLQEELTKACVPLPIIFVSGRANLALAVKAMKAGAVDFLTKPVSDQDLLEAVFAALERDRLRRAQEAFFSALHESFNSLSPREHEVLLRVAEGMANKQIAGELGISEIMVKVHRSKGMRKLQMHSVTDLVRLIDALAGYKSAPPRPLP